MEHLIMLLSLLFFVCLFSVLSGVWIEPFVGVINAQPTKCFDCEKQLSAKNLYLSGPSKCFSCEKELIKLNGPEYAALAQPTKCFDCEKQLLN